MQAFLLHAALLPAWQPASHAGIGSHRSPGVRRCAVPHALFLSDDKYRIVPCADETAALLVGSVKPVENSLWVAVMPGLNPLVTQAETSIVPAFIANYNQPVVVGEKPLAVGRLRRGPGIIDKLASSLPKEDAASDALLELTLDHLILAWLAYLGAQPAAEAQRFEALTAATTLHTAAVFERRGFAEIENPDMTALSRGEPISSHSARLPAAIVAFTHRSTLGDGSPAAAAMAEEILQKLREQAAPLPLPAEQSPPPSKLADEDRWSAFRARNGY